MSHVRKQLHVTTSCSALLSAAVSAVSYFLAAAITAMTNKKSRRGLSRCC